MRETVALRLPPAPRRTWRWHADVLRAAVLIGGSAIVGVACGPLQLPEETAPPRQAAKEPARSARPAPPVAPAVVTGGTGPRKIALLLPLSDAQRAAGEAVRDGFIPAYLADAAGSLRPEVMVLDEQKPGAAAAYQAAVAAGAQAVVGPLLKESVTEVARVAGATPLLTLNYLDSVTPPADLYQFALAPEDEARAVAERAAALGQLRAVVLVPDSEWGRRMLTAFTTALEERGGTVIAYRLYDPAARDYTAQIQRLLLLDESRARHRQLASNLGVSLEFEPRRRDDLDCIFLAASSAAGRLIRPQLRFLYAGDVPTYATSAIYQPGAAGDADLDGIMFTDAPALIGTDPRATALRSALASRWPPGSVARLRLYAMGYDAYALLQAARPGISPLPAPLPGLSGVLSIDSSRRIHRGMAWATFRDGQIVPLPEAPVPASGPGPG